ncbi:MAG: hypothetical protein N4A47_04535 [Clostridia bacterium]|jgi:hypothetical protein|nr:hypothetical protein [Clostridia bacterium]
MKKIVMLAALMFNLISVDSNAELVTVDLGTDSDVIPTFELEKDIFGEAEEGTLIEVSLIGEEEVLYEEIEVGPSKLFYTSLEFPSIGNYNLSINAKNGENVYNKEVEFEIKDKEIIKELEKVSIDILNNFFTNETGDNIYDEGVKE